MPFRRIMFILSIQSSSIFKKFFRYFFPLVTAVKSRTIVVDIRFCPHIRPETGDKKSARLKNSVQLLEYRYMDRNAPASHYGHTIVEVVLCHDTAKKSFIHPLIFCYLQTSFRHVRSLQLGVAILIQLFSHQSSTCGHVQNERRLIWKYLSYNVAYICQTWITNSK